MSKKTPRLPQNVLAPNRARLLELCDMLRTETQRDGRIAAMITRLVEEASVAETATARVNAAKAVVSYAIQAESLAADIEAGAEDLSDGKSGAVQILVMAPDGQKRAPDGVELAGLLEAVSASVRAESRDAKN